MTKKEVKERVTSLVEKSKALPEDLREDVIMEASLLEDAIMDRMFRSIQRRAAAEGKKYAPVFYNFT